MCATDVMELQVLREIWNAHRKMQVMKPFNTQFVIVYTIINLLGWIP